MVSIAEYAKEKQISYQAVNQQIKRYQKELKGHIQKKGKTRFLDDEAVEFLNQKRKDNPVTVVQEGRVERITELEDQVKVLTARIVDLQDRLIKTKDTIEQLQADNIKLLTAAAAAAAQGAKAEPETEPVEEIQGEEPGSPQEAPQRVTGDDAQGAEPEPHIETTTETATDTTTTETTTTPNRFIRAWRVLCGKE